MATWSRTSSNLAGRSGSIPLELGQGLARVGKDRRGDVFFLEAEKRLADRSGSVEIAQEIALLQAPGRGRLEAFLLCRDVEALLLAGQLLEPLDALGHKGPGLLPRGALDRGLHLGQGLGDGQYLFGDLQDGRAGLGLDDLGDAALVELGHGLGFRGREGSPVIEPPVTARGLPCRPWRTRGPGREVLAARGPIPGGPWPGSARCPRPWR